VWIEEQTAIISLYYINWVVFIFETACLLRGTDWVFIYNSGLRKNLRSAHTVFLCGFQNKRRLFPYTTLTDFYNRDGVCLLRGTDWVFNVMGYAADHSQLVAKMRMVRAVEWNRNLLAHSDAREEK